MIALASAWAWISGSEWFRKLVVILGLLLAVLLALAGIRRRGEEAGKLIERETHRVEAEKTRKRVEAVKRKMEEVPRPDRSDVVDKLRDGKF